MDRIVEIESGLGGSEETYLLASSNPKKKAGRKKFKETRHPVYRGVRRRGGGKWVCELRNGKSRLWLGTYASPEMAARAHDVAALALRGRSACLNFADSAWRLPVPRSTSDADIRAAASAAAEAFRTSSSSEEGGCSYFGSGREYEGLASDSESCCSGSDCTRAEEGGLCSRGWEQLEVNGGAGCNNNYVDEEAIFSMPELLVDLAEGLMVPPPPTVFGESPNHWDCGSDVSIWNYSTW